MRNIILTNLNFVTAQVLKSLVWEEHWAFLSNVFQITKALKQNQQHINKNKPPHYLQFPWYDNEVTNKKNGILLCSCPIIKYMTDKDPLDTFFMICNLNTQSFSFFFE